VQTSAEGEWGGGIMRKSDIPKKRSRNKQCRVVWTGRFDLSVGGEAERRIGTSNFLDTKLMKGVRDRESLFRIGPPLRYSLGFHRKTVIT